MFNSFWNNECDAVLYDAPLLEYNLHQRTSVCATSGCLANGLLVGGMRTQDPYGIVLPEGHPAYEALSIASISRITATDFSERLRKRWFPGEDSEDNNDVVGDETAHVQFEWRFVVACAIGSACVTIGTIAHWYYYGWHAIKMRADVDEVPADTHECALLLVHTFFDTAENGYSSCRGLAVLQPANSNGNACDCWKRTCILRMQPVSTT